MKRIFTLAYLCFFALACAQVGINTINPRAILHVDGAKDNPDTGNLSASQSLNDFVVNSDGMVGIRLADPQKSLDINANSDALRIRQLATANNWASETTQILVRNPTSGDVNGISYVYRTTVTLQPTTTQIITIPAAFANAILMLSTGNACGRTMVSTFNTNDRAINFLGGIARDVIAQRAMTPIPASGSGSATWTITFPNVLNCQGDGTGIQFNYLISKPSASTIELSNLGDVARTYQIVLKRY